MLTELSLHYICVLWSAAKNQHGVYFLNGEFAIDNSQTKVIAGSAFQYRRSRGGKERLFSKGPLTEPLHVEVFF